MILINLRCHVIGLRLRKNVRSYGIYRDMIASFILVCIFFFLECKFIRAGNKHFETI